MTVGTAITIAISAASLVLALLAASFKLSKSISDSAASNAASNAELRQSNKDLQKSLDEFKTTSRAEHIEFRREMDEDRVLLAKQGTEIKAHEKTLNNHENRLTLLERGKTK